MRRRELRPVTGFRRRVRLLGCHLQLLYTDQPNENNLADILHTHFSHPPPRTRRRNPDPFGPASIGHFAGPLVAAFPHCITVN